MASYTLEPRGKTYTDTLEYTADTLEATGTLEYTADTLEATGTLEDTGMLAVTLCVVL